MSSCRVGSVQSVVSERGDYEREFGLRRVWRNIFQQREDHSVGSIGRECEMFVRGLCLPVLRVAYLDLSA
jgi:hypothetical protein